MNRSFPYIFLGDISDIGEGRRLFEKNKKKMEKTQDLSDCRGSNDVLRFVKNVVYSRNRMLLCGGKNVG